VIAWGRDAAWFFEVSPGKALRSIHESRPPSEGGEKIVFNRNGTIVAHTIGRTLKLRDPRTGTEWAALTNQSFAHVLADPTGQGFCLTGSGAWYRWPVERRPDGQGLVIPPLEPVGPSGDYRWAAISSDGQVSLVQHGQDHFHFFEGDRLVDRGKTKTTHPGARFSDLSPDGRWAASGAWHVAQVKVWNARTGDEALIIETDDMSSVAFSPDNRWLVVGGKDYRFFEVGTWREAQRLARPPRERFPPAMAFASDGKMLALCHTWKTIRLVQPESGQELATLEAPDPWNISHLSFSADASLLAVAGGTSEFHIWDLRLIREQLARLGLDWELPPYPPTGLVQPR
jgi:eukaryotic-like serine/threonine-protein kinase